MTLQNEGNPSEHFDFAEEVQRGFDESGKLPDRLIRYAKAHARTGDNLAQLELRINELAPTPHRKRLAELKPRLKACGEWLQFKDYYTVNKIRLTGANFCMCHLLCPLCAIRRGSKTLEAYLKRFEIIKAEQPHLKLTMLTLTVKNGDDLKERYKHLRKSLTLVLEWRRKTISGKAGYHSEFGKMLGLVGTIEITKDGALDGSASGWHPHAHIMVLHDERFDYKAAKAEWLKITGDSHVLNFKAAMHPNEPATDFMEVFKYAVKFGDLTPAQNIEAYEVLQGKRLLFSAGLFWGVEVPESQLDEELEELPYFERLYTYVVGSGYNLTSVTHKDDLPVKPAYLTPFVEKGSKQYQPKISTSAFDNFEIPEDIIKTMNEALEAVK